MQKRHVTPRLYFSVVLETDASPGHRGPNEGHWGPIFFVIAGCFQGGFQEGFIILSGGFSGFFFTPKGLVEIPKRVAVEGPRQTGKKSRRLSERFTPPSPLNVQPIGDELGT